MNGPISRELIATVAAVSVIFAALFILPFVIVGIAVGGLILAGYMGYVLYQKSPSVLEAKAKLHTQALYEAALAHHRPALDEATFLQGFDRHLRGTLPEAAENAAHAAALAIYSLESWGSGISPPPPICNSIEGARYRDSLSRTSSLNQHQLNVIYETLGECFNTALYPLPTGDEGDSLVSLPIASFTDELPNVVHDMVRAFHLDEAMPFFPNLRLRLGRNINAAGEHLPVKYTGADIVHVYFQDTPLEKFMSAQVPIEVPRHVRWEHTVITGGSGHGKTVLLENLILRDIKDPEQPTIVIIDSQRALINKVAHLAAVHERDLIIIDPKDNPALNVFAINTNRMREYNDVERERVLNHSLETFTYLFDSLLGADLTVRQGAMFNYIIMVMLAMPETMGRFATLKDIIDITENLLPYQPAINTLPQVGKDFFARDFQGPAFRQTKEQIRYRLHAIISNSTLGRLFLAQENPIDFFTELNNGTIILVDTDKGFLGSKNSAYLGQTAITLMLQAILERDASSHQHREVFMYVDEAAEYFDRSIDSFLTEARKHRAGITLAHQFLGQMQPELRASVAANTATKYAGGLSNVDARSAAPDMRTTHEFILAQERLNFACFVRNVTKSATSVPVRVGRLEAEPQVSEETYQAFRARNRERLAVTGTMPDVGPEPPKPDEEKDTNEW